MKQIDWDIIERKTEGTLSPEEEEIMREIIREFMD